MSERIAHYSPEDITVLIGGLYQVSGFVAGSFVSISKARPVFVEKESADGYVTRTNGSSKFFRVTLTLSSVSDSNQVLSYLSRLDEITNSAKFPIIIKDQLGSSLFFGTDCWISSVPNLTFSENIDSREWVISCADSVMNVGGNYDDSQLPEDILNIGAGLLSGVV